MKVGFAQWYIREDGPGMFCKRLEEFKACYPTNPSLGSSLNDGWQVLQEIKQKLEFTKFQCKPMTHPDDDWWGESCTELADFEDNHLYNAWFC